MAIRKYKKKNSRYVICVRIIFLFIKITVFFSFIPTDFWVGRDATAMIGRGKPDKPPLSLPFSLSPPCDRLIATLLLL